MFSIDINRICYSFTGSSLLSSRNFTHPTLFPHFLKTLCQEFSYNLAIPKISFLTSIKRLLILQSPANSSSILLVHRPTGASPLSPPPIIKVRKRNSDISITFVWKRGAPPLSLSLSLVRGHDRKEALHASVHQWQNRVGSNNERCNNKRATAT